MTAAPERSPERDAAIDAMLPHVPFDGWTLKSLRQGLSASGADPQDAALLFPGGAADMVEAFVDLTDRRMAEQAGPMDGLRTPAKVKRLIETRLALMEPNKAAVRRALSVLSSPRRAALTARITARTVDAIWTAAGDEAAGFSWYSKRAILSGVYSATLLYWLADQSEDGAATSAFLDRRLAGVGRIGKLRQRLTGGRRRAAAGA